MCVFYACTAPATNMWHKTISKPTFLGTDDRVSVRLNHTAFVFVYTPVSGTAMAFTEKCLIVCRKLSTITMNYLFRHSIRFLIRSLFCLPLLRTIHLRAKVCQGLPRQCIHLRIRLGSLLFITFAANRLFSLEWKRWRQRK